MNNGRNGWIRYLVCVIVCLVLFVALPTIASNMITNDKESRQRDLTLRDCVYDNEQKIDAVQLNIGEKLGAISVTIAEMRTDQKHIKKEIDKMGR